MAPRPFLAGIVVFLAVTYPVIAEAAPDRKPPTGTVKINNGAATTTSRTVTLTLTARDNAGGSGMVGGKAGMQIRNDNPRTWPANRYERFQPTKPWTLLAGNGPKTVYVKFRDKAGNAMRSPVSARIRVTSPPPDTTPPTTPVVTDDGAWTSSTTTLHATWSASDPQSGIAEYQYAIGIEEIGDVVPWTSTGTIASVTKTGLTLTNGVNYFFNVKAKNGAGLWSTIGWSDGIAVDATPPPTPVVTDDGVWTAADQISARWFSNDQESGILEYQYAIGTTIGSTDIVPWTSRGTATDVTHTGLSLSQGITYYVSAKAKNGVGLWSAIGISDGIQVDTPPTTPVVTDDGTFTADLTQIHARWTPSEDLESGVAEYFYAIGTTPGASDVVTWTSVGLAAEVTHTGLSLSNGATYYVNVRAKNRLGIPSPIGTSDGITVDTTPPTMPVVVDDGRWATVLTTLHATWTSSDPESGIVEYRYAIGTSVGGIEVVPWTTLDLATEVTKTGLTLTHGTTYYLSVKALNQVGAWSTVGTSDGITVDPSPPTTPIVTDDGETSPATTSLHASWNAADPESGIIEYQYAIGTAAGATDVVTWTSVGQAPEVTHRGIRLVKGRRYFMSVKAVNAVGLWSNVGVSDGLLIVNSPPKLEPIGDKLIRVRPPGITAQGAAPPPGGTKARATMTEDPAGPQILLLKLKADVTTPFETIVRAGQRLRARASPAHLKRLSAPADQRSHEGIMDHPSVMDASPAFSLEELCARHQIERSEPLFKTPSPRAGGVQVQGLSPKGTVPDVGLDRIFRIEVPRERIGEALQEFAQHPQVEYCEPRLKMETFLTTNDPYLSSSGSWGQSYPDLWGLKRMQAEQAWDITAGSPDVVVAVIDTGIDPDHPDLFPNLWHNAGEIPGNNRDDDYNGYVDDTWGWDFDSAFGNDRDPSDGHGHGTHVAGTIAAVGNNGQGIVGVAWRCQVMAVKGINDFGWGYDDDLARAIRYAADNGAGVINMSWGGEGRVQVLEDVIRYAHEHGVVLVAAAGNEDSDAGGFTPANIEQVVTVAATDHTDHRAPWSNYGTKIDVAAPGGDGDSTDGSNRAGANILSCRANSTDMYGDGDTLLGEYARARGTSMAAPHVAGLCALVRAKHPEWTNEQVRQALRMSADDIVDPLNDGTSHPGFDPYTGAGRINAHRALEIRNVPVAKITRPLPLQSVTGRIEIRGTAVSQVFLRYRLEVGGGDFPNQWTRIHESTTQVTDGALGMWDTSGFTPGTYTIRLSVWTSDLPNPSIIQHRVIVLPPMLPGWPIDLPNHDGHPWEVLAISDVDGDGQLDLILGTYGVVDVREINGKPKPGTVWPRNLDSYTAYPAQTHIADIDHDGDLEVVIFSIAKGFRDTWFLHVFEADGRTHSGRPMSASGSVFDTFFRFGDLDGDGTSELVVGMMTDRPSYGEWKRWVYVFRHDGTDMPGWPKVWPDQSLEDLRLADLYGDGSDEIIILAFAWDATRSHAIPVPLAFHADGTPVTGWSRPTDGVLTGASMFITDLNGDGDDEVLFNGYMPELMGYGLTALDGAGTLLPGWPLRLASNPTFCDVDGDGRLETIGKSATLPWPDWAMEFNMWHSNGQVASGWPITHETLRAELGGEIFVTDLDRDTNVELLLGRYDGFVGSREIHPTVHLVDQAGHILPGWPVRIPTPDTISSWILPRFADVNDDGRLEILATINGFYGRSAEVWAINTAGQPVPGWPIRVRFIGDLSVNDMDQSGDAELFLQVVTDDYQSQLWALDVPMPLPVPREQGIEVLDGRKERVGLIYPRVYVNGEKGYLAITPATSDADRDRLTYTITGKPAGASFNSKTGFFWWRPTEAEAGTYRITLSVSDGEATASETITITVRAGNKKPTLTLPAPSYTVDEAQPVEFTLQATDLDGDPIQFLGYDLPRGATLDRRTGQFSWRPDYTQAGKYLVSVAAGDGSLEDRKTLTITVRNINRAPTLTNPGAFTIKEGQILEFLLNALDPDGDPLTFSATNLPTGSILVSDTGLFSWQPTFQQAGSYGPITVTVSDGAANATASFTITVQDTPPWTAIPNKPVVNMTRITTPTNVPTQVLTGTKAAYTAVLINGVEVVPRDRFTTWQANVALTEGDNVLEIRARDVAGLMSDPVRTTVALDTALPDLTVTTPTPGQVIPLS